MILQVDNNKIVADLTALNNKINPNNGDCYFVTSESCVYNYYKNPRSQGSDKWVKDLDAVIYEKASVLSSNYTDLTVYFPNVLGTPIDEIKISYQKYQNDGVEYFNEVRANLVLDYKTGVRTTSDIFYIESKIESVTNKIMKGDWMTASYVMTNEVVFDTVLDEVFYNDILNYINNYIAENY